LRIGFSEVHDIMEDNSESFDCRYELSAAHNYKVDLQQIMLAGLVFNCP
jgi:hypothetical protein